jgi:hypothetical protein
MAGDTEIQVPVMDGRHRWPFVASIEDLAAVGYAEEEYVIAGIAPMYAPLTVPFLQGDSP